MSENQQTTDGHKPDHSVAQNGENEQSESAVQPTHPEWMQPLIDRSWSPETITRFGIKPRKSGGQEGWEYPVAPGVAAMRWKNCVSSAVPKYLWLPKMPNGIKFYDPHGDLADRITASNGVLLLAGGEPDVLALYEGGVPNSTCLLTGEAACVRDWFVPELQHLRVTTLVIAPDRDDAGRKFAQKVRDALAETDIKLIAYELPFEDNSKGDINCLLMDVGRENLRTTLESLPELDIDEGGALCSTPARSSKVHTSSHKLRERWCEMVQEAACVEWDVPEPNGREFSRTNISCPIHTDENPSASWNYRARSLHCFVCGEYKTDDVAALLGMPSWEEYRDEHRANASSGSGNGSRAQNQTADGDDKTSKPSHDELGDALIARWNGDVAFFRGNWHRYDNGCWVREENIMRDIWDIQREFKGHGIRPNKSATTSVEAYLKSRLFVADEEVDQGESYVNLGNGLYNLEEGCLQPHRRDLYLTSQLGFAYDPNSVCPVWEQCLQEWFAQPDGKADSERIALLQEAFGYSLTTDTSFQVAFWLYGVAGSGKSTAIAALKTLMGNASIELDLSALHRNHYQLAEIEGKRVVTCAEAAANSVLTDNTFKQLVSGEEIVARQIRQKSRRFTPVAKVWWAMNEMPHNQDRSNAVYRRLIIISFENPIPEERRDRRLDQKLEAEAAGIFNWALAGLQRLREKGCFTRTTHVQQALDEYRAENDAEALFLEEWCIEQADTEVRADDLYLAYKAWCETFGHRPKSKAKVSRDWKRLGLKKKRKSQGVFYLGITLTEEASKAANAIRLAR